MKNTILTRFIAALIALCMIAAALTACNDASDKAPNIPSNESNENLYDLTGFTIVRDSMGGATSAAYAAKLKQEIASSLGLSLEVALDSDRAAGDKEILIGSTDRAESKATIAYLDKKFDKNSFAVRIADGKIVLAGTDEISIARAVQEFISNYVRVSSVAASIDVSAGFEIVAPYDEESVIKTSGGVDLHMDVISTVAKNDTKYNAADGTSFVPEDASYPSITELRYQQNPENNGKLIAIMSLKAMEIYSNGSTQACVMMSENGGKTWKALARPTEQLFPSLGNVGTMAHLYELPAQVGEMPAGTLLYSYNAVNYDNPNGLNGKSILAVWRSFDCGVNWEEYVVIDEAKGIKEGIWEPFMIYGEEDGYLYCFYSDDSDPDHDQKIVYKRSKDGVNWEGKGGKIGTGTGKDVEPVDVVAVNTVAFRPGMPVIAKLGNGEYFMTYEQFGDGKKDWDGDCRIFYKTSKSLSDWGDPSDKGTMIPDVGNKKTASSPSCAWLDVGGECGILLVTSKRSTNTGVIFVIFDYGKTWETIEDPLKGTIISEAGKDRVGYSAGLWIGADGKTLYYVNSTNSHNNPTGAKEIGFVKFRLYDALLVN